VPPIASDPEREREDEKNEGMSAVGRGRLYALIAYGRKVFDLRHGFESVRDRRREPKVAPALVAAAISFCGLLRTRSFNALEPKLREKPFRPSRVSSLMFDRMCVESCRCRRVFSPAAAISRAIILSKQPAALAILHEQHPVSSPLIEIDPAALIEGDPGWITDRSA
jgi:hypothetical protein